MYLMTTKMLNAFIDGCVYLEKVLFLLLLAGSRQADVIISLACLYHYLRCFQACIAKWDERSANDGENGDHLKAEGMACVTQEVYLILHQCFLIDEGQAFQLLLATISVKCQKVRTTRGVSCGLQALSSCCVILVSVLPTQRPIRTNRLGHCSKQSAAHCHPNNSAAMHVIPINH